VYAITKRDHEELFVTVGRAYGVPTVALRYFNVYGPRQSLANPYTGVAAIFSSRLLNGEPPLIFEDGKQSRDFIHVSDVVRANLLALEKPEADGQVFNVGTGRSLNLLDMVDALQTRLGGPDPVVEGESRQGDIRHCYADISRIKQRLGFEAKLPFEDGVEDLAAWAREQAPMDVADRAQAELRATGLTQ
jgi:dTDP-L-rhamnose 4-epimerase